MAPDLTLEELQLITRLDSLVFRSDILPEIQRVAAILCELLQKKPTAAFVRAELPPALYGSELPAGVRSSNIYVIRPLVSSGLERHPNSHQRSMSLSGSGVFELGLAEAKRVHPIFGLAGAAPASRWVSIPPATWHQAIAGSEPWTVVTFHTAPDQDIINERM